MSAIGRHLLAELCGCNDAIDDRDAVERAILEAVAASGATLLHLRVHPFEPRGVTALALLSESHLALHTWPETGYAAADLFTCGDHVEGERAIEVLRAAFEPEHVELRAIDRGPIAPLPRNGGAPGCASQSTRTYSPGRPHCVADAADSALNAQRSTLNPPPLSEALP